MRKVFIIVCLTLVSSLVFAQKEGHREKIESALIAHITNELALSPKQAQKFWPVYNELTNKREEINNKQRELYAKAKDGNLSDNEAKQLLKERISLKRKELDLEDEYYNNKLLDSVSPSQVIKLIKAEKEFKRILLHRLRDHDHDHRNGNRSREQIQN